MAQITKEQVIKLNSQLSNGFKMDIMQLLHGEKVPTKKVELGDNKYLSASLHFMERYSNRQKSINIEMNVSLWRVDANGTGVSHGLGKWYVLEEGLQKKLFKKLAAHTATISDEMITNVYNEERAALENGVILG